MTRAENGGHALGDIVKYAAMDHEITGIDRRAKTLYLRPAGAPEGSREFLVGWHHVASLAETGYWEAREGQDPVWVKPS
jgi:hypothetical protein